MRQYRMELVRRIVTSSYVTAFAFPVSGWVAWTDLIRISVSPMTIRYSHLTPEHQQDAVQRLVRPQSGTRSGTGTAAPTTARQEQPRKLRGSEGFERAGDRGRTGDVQLGKLSGPLRGKGFSAAVAEMG